MWSCLCSWCWRVDKITLWAGSLSVTSAVVRIRAMTVFNTTNKINNTSTVWPTTNLSADFEQNCLTAFERRYSQTGAPVFLLFLFVATLDVKFRLAALDFSGLSVGLDRFRGAESSQEGLDHCVPHRGGGGAGTFPSPVGQGEQQIPAQFHGRGRQSRAADPLLFDCAPDIQSSPSAFITCLSLCLVP